MRPRASSFSSCCALLSATLSFLFICTYFYFVGTPDQAAAVVEDEPSLVTSRHVPHTPALPQSRNNTIDDDTNAIAANASQTHRVGLVLYGSSRHLEYLKESVFRNVVEVYDADVFFAGSDEVNSSLSFFGKNLKGSHFEDLDASRMSSLYSSFPEADYFRSWNLLSLSPAGYQPWQNNTGVTLALLMWQDLAYRMLQLYEHTHSHRYTWIVNIRTDVEFRIPAPPLKVLADRLKSKKFEVNHVWIPRHEESGNTLEYVAIVHRSFSDVYFGQWRAMVSGRYARVVRFMHCSECTTEKMLHIWLVEHYAHIHRLPPIATPRCVLADGTVCREDNVSQKCFSDCSIRHLTNGWAAAEFERRFNDGLKQTWTSSLMYQYNN